MQSSGGVLQIKFFEKLQKIHRKIPKPESLFNEILALETCNVVKLTPAKMFHGNFAKFEQMPLNQLGIIVYCPF